MAKRHLLAGLLVLQGLSVVAMDKNPLARSKGALRQSTERLSKSQEIQIPQSKKTYRSGSSSSSSDYHSPCGNLRYSWERKDDLKPLPPYSGSDCP